MKKAFDMRNILFATDFSAEAQLAQQRAEQLATFFNARLRVIHVAEKESDAADAGSHPMNGSLVYGSRASVETIHGDPCEVISTLAQGLDLLVLGIPRRRSAGELFTGTTGERIIRRAPAPVLVVRADATDDYRRVVVAVDIAHQPAAVLRVARTMTRASADCEVIYAYDSPQVGLMVEASTYSMNSIRQHIVDQRRDLTRKLNAEMMAAKMKGRANAVEIESSAADTIIAFSEQRSADLIVLGSRRPGIVKFVLGSVATQVLSRAGTDVLIVPPATQ